jgi:hypothetical protein
MVLNLRTQLSEPVGRAQGAAARWPVMVPTDPSPEGLLVSLAVAQLYMLS